MCECDHSVMLSTAEGSATQRLVVGTSPLVRPRQGVKQTSSNLHSLAVVLLAMEKTQASVVKFIPSTCAAEASRSPSFRPACFTGQPRVYIETLS